MERGQYLEAIGREADWIEARLSAHRNEGSEVEQRLPGGQWLKIAERKTPDGSTVGFRVDITELKSARLAAESANESKSEFLNTVSHELRTPLTVIRGFLAFLRRPNEMPAFKALGELIEKPEVKRTDLDDAIGDVRDEIADFARRIENSSEHLLGLVKGILDFSAIEEGSLQLAFESVEIDELLEAVSEQFASAARVKGLDFNVSSAKGSIWADPLRLKQTLINLVGNAVKFTDSGFVSVSARIVGENAESLFPTAVAEFQWSIIWLYSKGFARSTPRRVESSAGPA